MINKLNNPVFSPDNLTSETEKVMISDIFHFTQIEKTIVNLQSGTTLIDKLINLYKNNSDDVAIQDIKQKIDSSLGTSWQTTLKKLEEIKSNLKQIEKSLRKLKNYIDSGNIKEAMTFIKNNKSIHKYLEFYGIDYKKILSGEKQNIWMNAPKAIQFLNDLADIFKTQKQIEEFKKEIWLWTTSEVVWIPNTTNEAQYLRLNYQNTKVLFTWNSLELQQEIKQKLKENLWTDLYSKLNKKLKELQNLQLFNKYMKIYAKINNYQDLGDFTYGFHFWDEMPIFVKWAYFADYRRLFWYIIKAAIKWKTKTLNILLKWLSDKNILDSLVSINGAMVSNRWEILSTPKDRKNVLKMLKTWSQADIEWWFAEKMKDPTFIQNDVIWNTVLKDLNVSNLVDWGINNVDKVYKALDNFTLFGKKISLSWKKLSQNEIKSTLEDFRKQYSDLSEKQRFQIIYAWLVKKQLDKLEGDETFINQFKWEQKKKLELYYKNNDSLDNFKKHWVSYLIKWTLLVSTAIVTDKVITSILPEWAVLWRWWIRFVARVVALQNATWDMSLLLNDQLTAKNAGSVLSNIGGYIHTAAYMTVLEWLAWWMWKLWKLWKLDSLKKIWWKLETLWKWKFNLKNFALYWINVWGIVTLDTVVFDWKFTPEEMVNALMFAALMWKTDIKIEKWQDWKIKIIWDGTTKKFNRVKWKIKPIIKKIDLNSNIKLPKWEFSIEFTSNWKDYKVFRENYKLKVETAWKTIEFENLKKLDEYLQKEWIKEDFLKHQYIEWIKEYSKKIEDTYKTENGAVKETINWEKYIFPKKPQIIELNWEKYKLWKKWADFYMVKEVKGSSGNKTYEVEKIDDFLNKHPELIRDFYKNIILKDDNILKHIKNKLTPTKKNILKNWYTVWVFGDETKIIKDIKSNKFYEYKNDNLTEINLEGLNIHNLEVIAFEKWNILVWSIKDWKLIIIEKNEYKFIEKQVFDPNTQFDTFVNELERLKIFEWDKITLKLKKSLNKKWKLENNLKDLEKEISDLEHKINILKTKQKEEKIIYDYSNDIRNFKNQLTIKQAEWNKVKQKIGKLNKKISKLKESSTSNIGNVEKLLETKWFSEADLKIMEKILQKVKLDPAYRESILENLNKVENLSDDEIRKMWIFKKTKEFIKEKLKRNPKNSWKSESEIDKEAENKAMKVTKSALGKTLWLMKKVLIKYPLKIVWKTLKYTAIAILLIGGWLMYDYSSDHKLDSIEFLKNHFWWISGTAWWFVLWKYLFKDSTLWKIITSVVVADIWNELDKYGFDWFKKYLWWLGDTLKQEL